jgi:hypothetical protein
MGGSFDILAHLRIVDNIHACVTSKMMRARGVCSARHTSGVGEEPTRVKILLQRAQE